MAAGAVLIGTGLIAVTPGAIPDLQQRAVQLTSFDPLAAWTDVFNAAQANATEINNFVSAVPFVALQQEIVNQVGYVQDLIKDPSSISTVLTDMQTKAQNAFDAATFLGGDQVNFINPLDNATLDTQHSLLFLYLTNQLGGLGIPGPAEPIPTIVDFLASPLSGVLIGALGPEISPWVALANSLTEIGDTLSCSASPALCSPDDWTTALQDLANIPANMVGGFLNGATLDLGPLIPAIEQLNLVPMPQGASIDSLSFTFGGLLSPGATNGVAMFGSGPGGSILNSVGMGLSGVPIFGTLDAPGHGVGPLSAWENLSQMIAIQLGWVPEINGTTGLAIGPNPLDALFPPAPADATASTDTMGGLLDGSSLTDLSHELFTLF
ncbi:outer membrane porin GjpA [[Mycobacterium] nativiensis]|uniref:Outer membrane porin GjpA n=1 Tax=[Mycobacterium] nativiensis TaxID=2855503 RepID=A0ABU5Y1N9_9MYCO|nr:outer membrane porin GjpA [Mycolicibacter sp. MYC340]MEB3034155.1 outer membrane porin GjpA [Mycolicibacter sp. MYC340]